MDEGGRATPPPAGPTGSGAGVPAASAAESAAESAEGLAAGSAERAFVRAVEAQRAGRLAEAQRLYGEALAGAPDHLQALNNLGVLLRRRGRPAAAEACLRRALANDPRNSGTLANLGNLLVDARRLAEARACFAAAAAARPEDASLWHALGRCQRDLGETGAAVASLGKALALADDERQRPPVAVDLALALLRQGDYASGLEAYEARWKLPELTARHGALPAWDGGDPAGKRLLLWAEQGPSETLLFARYAPLLAARGAAVTLEVQPELAPLLQGLPGAARVAARGEIGARDEAGARSEAAAPAGHDLQAPLASLPYLFRTRIDSVPAEIPYLPAPARRVALPPAPAGVRRVGLIWSAPERPRPGGPAEPGLARLLSLATVPGVQLFGLQKGRATAELLETGAAGLVRDLSHLLEGWRDLAGALLQLDLLVTLDTPAAHLAGGLGRPAWVLLPAPADWPWGVGGADMPPGAGGADIPPGAGGADIPPGAGGADTFPGAGGARTPWYPSLRLFRQPAPGDWDGAVAAARAALAEWAA
jgi:tetratricopeptide (TPR) repeat protein